MINLGTLYYNGHGVAQDYQKALQWYQRAADAGSAVGMYSLGYMYEIGHGVTQDYQQARQWYQKAVAAGSGAAKERLQTLPQ